MESPDVDARSMEGWRKVDRPLPSLVSSSKPFLGRSSQGVRAGNVEEVPGWLMESPPLVCCLSGIQESRQAEKPLLAPSLL